MAISAVMAAISTVTTGFAVAAGTGAFIMGTALSHFLVTTAMGAALNALAPNPDSSGGAVGGYSISGVSGAALDHQIVYGEAKVGGARVYDSSTGSDNKFLHRILIFAGHTIESYVTLYIEDEEITLDGAGMVTAPAKYAGLIRIKQYLGAPNQTADADLIAETASLTDGKWTSAHRLRELAYLYVRFQHDSDAFSGGVPTISAKIRGKKVFDPRSAAIAWSRNPALCIRDYMVNAYGMNQPNNRISDAFFSAAADICDETVAGDLRYTCDGAFVTASEPDKIIKSLLSSMGGIMWFSQGRWKVRASKYTAPSLSFDEDDLRSGIRLATRFSRRESFNAVSGTFRGDTTEWQTTDYPKVSDPAYLAVDGGYENVLDLPLPFTSNPARCQRIANIVLRRNREQLAFSASFGLRAMQVEVSDVIKISIARFGWTNKPFEVTRWGLSVAGSGLIVVEMTLREISSAVFTNVDPSIFESNNSTLPDPFSGIDISNLQVELIGNLQKDGTIVNTAQVTWDVAQSGYVDFYNVRWKPTAATAWTQTKVQTREHRIEGLRDSVQYTVGVQSVTTFGNKSAWLSLTFTNDGDVTAPAQPTSISTTAGYSALTVTWTNPTVADFKHVEVWFNFSNTTTGATLLGTTDGTAFLHTGLAIGVTRWYFLKSVDRSGNKSDFTSGVSGTTVPIPAVDLSGVLDIAQFAATIRPVEVLPALPTTDNFAGRMVFLTTDGKLYRHTGSPAGAAGFTKATDGADIVANSITAGQIQAGAIGATEIAAQAIIASKLAVSDFTNLVPDNQLQDLTAWQNSNFTVLPTTSAAVSGLSKGEIRYTGAYGIGTQLSLGLRFAVKADQEFWFQYALAKTSAGSTYRAYAQIVWWNTAGAEISVVSVGPSNVDRTNGTPLFIDGSVTAPANAVSASWRWVVQTGSTDAPVRMWAPTIRIKNGGELIVDGTITGDKVAANTIEAGNMAANSITAGNGAIADLTVDTLQIKGQAVTVPVRAQQGGNIRITSSVTWIKILQLVIPRQGYATELRFSCGVAGFGNGVAHLALYRGETKLNQVAHTIGLQGRAVTVSWNFIDWNTASGNTTYSLRIRKGGLSPYDYDLQVGVRFLSAVQFKR